MTIFSTIFWVYRRDRHCHYLNTKLLMKNSNSYIQIRWKMKLHFNCYRAKRNTKKPVHCCAGHSSTVTILKIWLGPPCLGNAMTGVPGSLLPSDTSSTWSISLLIVPSSSKCHSWLGPPWGSNMDTFPVSWFTSSTSLDTKIPNVEIFKVSGNVY